MAERIEANIGIYENEAALTYLPVSIARLQENEQRFIPAEHLVIGQTNPEKHEQVGILERYTIPANGHLVREEERVIFFGGAIVYTVDIHEMDRFSDDVVGEVHKARKQGTRSVFISKHNTVHPLGKFDVVRPRKEIRTFLQEA